MIEDAGNMQKWERLAAELSAYREAQRQLWGDVDDVLLARFLSKQCTQEEQQTVQRTIQSFPAVSELVGLLDEIFETPEVVLQREDSAAQVALKSVWDFAASGIRLAERLVAWVDETGKLISSGLLSLAVRPEFAYGTTLGQTESDTASWQIPIAEPDRWLILTVRPPRGGDKWELACRVQSPSDATFAHKARMEIRKTTGEVELASRLADCAGQPIYLSVGIWHLCVILENETRRIEFQIGEPSTAG